MTNPFRYYKEKFILFKHCKISGCPASYRPERRSFFARLGLCVKHRKEYYRQWYVVCFKKWLSQQTPETKLRYKNYWCKWIELNPDRRRKIALNSYHRQKDGKRVARNAKRREFYIKTGR